MPDISNMSSDRFSKVLSISDKSKHVSVVFFLISKTIVVNVRVTTYDTLLVNCLFYCVYQLCS